jgi:putative membrane protein
MQASLPFRLVMTTALAGLLHITAMPAFATSQDAKAAPEKAPPPPLLDENGNPFPPARPKAPDFNPEIAASRFAELAMAETLMELALSDVAAGKAESQAVKDLAHRLATNHAAVKLILTKAAGGSAAALPSTLSPEQQQVIDRLSACNGAEFDREYLWEAILRQPRIVTMYRWQYENCDEPRLKQFAVGTMPIMVVHARVADEAHRKINADEIAVQEKRAAAERKLEQERKLAEAQAAADAAAKKGQRKFRK